MIRENDVLSRWGGDEFTLILPQIKDKKYITGIARRIIKTFEKPIIINDEELYVTPSIGIAIYPIDGDDQNTIVKNADKAMYLIKEIGGNNYKFHSSNNSDLSIKRFALTNDLRKALANEEFLVYYQPIVDINTGKIVGNEALLRWNHPRLGLVQPNEFIPIAEKTGLIVPIGDWVIRKACKQNKEWQDAGLQPMYISINLSARQFRQNNLVRNISKIITEIGIEPRWVRIEITESTAVKNVEFTIKSLEQLHSLGINIAIDDFGTGYSSLNYLRRFPIHTLKIDRSFVKDINYSSEDKMIVSAILALAKSLKQEVVAEGIETTEQLDVLRAKGCHLIQGYLFSTPQPPKELEKLISSFAARQ